VSFRRESVLIDLALQGGGSHGAFTWGVLDRLLEEPWLRIEAISGTSAGAMNAAVLADGLRAERKAHERRSTPIGSAYRVPRRSAHCNVRRSTGSWAAGHSTHLPPTSPWI
jgi:NTE family protein